MKYDIQIGNHTITLEHDRFDDIVNVDDLTKIDVSNLYGEATTISAVVNRIGLMSAELESVAAEKKLDLKIYESDYKSKKRKEAMNNGGHYFMRVGQEDVRVKLTEKSLESCFETEERWIEKKRALIDSERQLSALNALYWACQDKARKLNGITSGSTPEEFIQGLVQGKVNGIMVTKKGNRELG